MKTVVSAALFYIAVVFLALMTAGCAEWSVVKSSVARHGAAVADELLITAQWLACDEVSVGAVRRKYAGDPAGLAAWQSYCTLKEQKAVAP